MADRDMNATPLDDGTIDDSPQTQPQTDPNAAPAGTTDADNQGGTTGTEKVNEPLYQTRYQHLVERLRAQGLDPDDILSSEMKPGSIRTALSQLTPAQQQQVATQAQRSPEDDIEEQIDPAYKQYFERQFGRLHNNMEKTLRGVVQEVEQMKRFEAEANLHFGEFDQWAAETKVPQSAVDKAVAQYHNEFGLSGTPKAVVKLLKVYLAEQGYGEARTKSQNSQIQDALAKSRALDAVAQPAQGTVPAPASGKEKTWQQKEADGIAPEKGYVYPV